MHKIFSKVLCQNLILDQCASALFKIISLKYQLTCAENANRSLYKMNFQGSYSGGNHYTICVGICLCMHVVGGWLCEVVVSLHHVCWYNIIMFVYACGGWVVVSVSM